MFRNFKALKRVINIDQNTLAVSFSDKDFTLTHEMKRQKFQDPVTETSISWMKNHSQNIFHNSHTTDYDKGKNPTFGDVDPSLRTTREPTNVFYDTDGFSTSWVSGHQYIVCCFPVGSACDHDPCMQAVLPGCWRCCSASCCRPPRPPAPPSPSSHPS